MAMLTSVLVVDDDQATRELIVDVLEDEGYVVHAADTAPQALSAVEAESYDIILLDLRMPGIDGVALFHLLDRRSLITMPIIFMTADSHAMHEVVTEGGKFILFKPFDIDTLLECVAEALRSPRQTRRQGIPAPAQDDPTLVPDDVHICA